MAQKFQHKLEKFEYNSDEVPMWYNYANAPTLHGKKKMGKSNEAPNWINFDDSTWTHSPSIHTDTVCSLSILQ